MPNQVTDTTEFLRECMILSHSNTSIDIELCVVLLVYNQSKFLERAIESVLNQEWRQGWILCIHDDASEDRAKVETIVKKYHDRYPEKIHAFLQSENKFSKSIEIVEQIVNAIKPQFVARLDADDYWTNSTKLLRQIEIMEDNPGVSLSYHEYAIEYQTDNVDTEMQIVEYSKNPYDTKWKIALGNAICPSTVIYKSCFLEDFPHDLKKIYIRDYPAWIMLNAKGNIYLLKENWTTYTIHSGNGFARGGNSRFKRDTLEIYSFFARKGKKSLRVIFYIVFKLRFICYSLDRFLLDLPTTTLNAIVGKALNIKVTPQKSAIHKLRTSIRRRRLIDS